MNILSTQQLRAALARYPDVPVTVCVGDTTYAVTTGPLHGHIDWGEGLVLDTSHVVITVDKPYIPTRPAEQADL